MRYSQSEKMQIIRIVEESPVSVKQTLLELNVNRSTFYKWYRRYQEGGYEALANRYRPPRQFWNALPPWEKKRVVEIALEHPEKAKCVIAVDIAPVPYNHSFRGFTGAMQCIPLSHIKSRKEAEDYLCDVAPEPAIRAFLLHNLRRDKDQNWHWRINLPVIADQLPAITGFSLSDHALNYHGPTLFIRGGRSTYVLDEHWPEVQTLFPYAGLETVPDTGHWLHAEEPEQVTALIRGFLDENG